MNFATVNHELVFSVLLMVFDLNTSYMFQKIFCGFSLLSSTDNLATIRLGEDILRTSSRLLLPPSPENIFKITCSRRTCSPWSYVCKRHLQGALIKIIKFPLVIRVPDTFKWDISKTIWRRLQILQDVLKTSSRRTNED